MVLILQKGKDTEKLWLADDSNNDSVIARQNTIRDIRADRERRTSREVVVVASRSASPTEVPSIADQAPSTLPSEEEPESFDLVDFKQTTEKRPARNSWTAETVSTAKCFKSRLS